MTVTQDSGAPQPLNGWLLRLLAVWLLIVFTAGLGFLTYEYVERHQLYLSGDFNAAWGAVQIAIGALLGYFAHKLTAGK